MIRVTVLPAVLHVRGVTELGALAAFNMFCSFLGADGRPHVDQERITRSGRCRR